jgi:hypothetical protein
MSATLTVVVDDHKSALKEMAKFKKDFGRLLRQQGKLAIRDMAKFTPPFSETTSQESFAAQRKVGQSAVKRDIERVFQRASKIGMLQNPKGALAKAIQSHNWQEVEQFMQRAGFPNARVFQSVDPALHARARNRRGRVDRKPASNFIFDERSLDRYIRLKQSHVGKAKSGWTIASNVLNVGLPNWITKQAGPGECLDASEAPIWQRITFGNLVSWIQEQGAELQIVSRALANRARAMRREAEEILKARAAKASKLAEQRSRQIGL